MSNFQFANLTINNSTTCFANDANTVDLLNMGHIDHLMSLEREKEAYDFLVKHIFAPINPTNSKRLVDLNAIALAASILSDTDRVAEVDEFIERALEFHKDDWRIVEQIANIYNSIEHRGYLINDKFIRAKTEIVNGLFADSHLRDRVIALRLFVQMMPRVLNDENKTDAANFFVNMADILYYHRGYPLQSLTDISKIPDYQDKPYKIPQYAIAAVDKEGNPIFYNIPASFESAKNDGERWRWTLDQAAKLDPQVYIDTLITHAYICQELYDNGNLLSKYDPIYQFEIRKNNPQLTALINMLKTLKDDETVAHVPGGIKYFKLPDEHNFIKIFREIYEKQSRFGDTLAQIYLHRNQFTKAAKIYETRINSLANDSKYSHIVKEYRQALSQIKDNWGEFARGSTIDGTNANLRYVFRNGKHVKLSIQKFKKKVVIDEIKSSIAKYKKINALDTLVPDTFDRRFFNVLSIARNDMPVEQTLQKINEAKEKYLEKEIITIDKDLIPAKDHFDSAVIFHLPVSEPGFYFVKAEMENGNISNAIVRLNDTVIVQRELMDSFCWFVADAVTGEPIKNANVQCFNFHKTESSQKNKKKYLMMQSIERKTDKNGLAFVDKKILKNKSDDRTYHQFLTIASNADGRFATHGLDNILPDNNKQNFNKEYKQVKSFVITDRPVYRPNDKVELKVWISTVQYDKKNVSEWAGKNIGYTISDPDGKRILQNDKVKLDNYGSTTATFNLPQKAALGSYSIYFYSDERMFIPYNDECFLVEEYKKPEYEVTVDSPVEPVTLGDKFNVKISAKYFFGSPVTEATVCYKVLRNKVDLSWYPVRLWDWFYGNGYSWFAYECSWIQGWEKWGCHRPRVSQSYQHGYNYRSDDYIAQPELV
ncbi:MAG: hypothetical protein LBQ66_07495, partial [Planctomycetaceae bacterium]|nr:hypothetical protein [Planctomycetaceae bacterium]